ncbi:autotransporter outer membrane beta-barrel domain-containing protein [Polynucleobacter sp. 31A-FELB]|uniref:autotransporter outer membrane beta-barrel domain-containing protein n=1 Tax=Polynucleobacter sp. 31A-FELB TaxID=2689096 RepID=UPI001C0AB71E|nr:autotransporter outer membrane beta-barrel domain-containing protein [Polynucleobacter sp. 31A-FELB]MBU3587452.1 autotransporter outer membrane beta-barrel domain-containing protein [Polynucleobacter sp. 31A-FELB]
MKFLNIKKLFCSFVLMLSALFGVNVVAQTTTVNVGGSSYTVTKSGLLSYNSSASLIQGFSAWGNASLASSLATAVGSSLGYPNGALGPLFAISYGVTAGRVQYYAWRSTGVLTDNSIGGALGTSSFYFACINDTTCGGTITPSGPTAANTQTSLRNTANALHGTYVLQNAVIANSFSYDCTEFGASGVCVSAGGRNTAVSATNGLNNTSALLIAAYRPHPSYRIGAYADQNLSVNNAGTTVNLGNNTPLIGLFGAWNERLDGTGTEVKVSAAYGQKSTTVTRQVVGTSEGGSGSSQLNSQGAQVTAKYGFAVTDKVIVSPYIGMRYTQNNMGGYTEGTSSSVTTPLTYSALNTNATTALAGIGASYKVIPTVTTFASAGVETDTNTANGTYSGTSSSIPGLTSVNFNSNPVKTRPTATLGAYYDIAKNQRLGITGIYRQEAYQAVQTTTVLATYTIGL